MTSSSLVHVAVAVIRDHSGRVLLSRRAETAHQGGLWEFPGGKVEPGETLPQALRRELMEELGIGFADHGPLIRITHHYPDRSVLLDVHEVTGLRGAPRGLEGQPLRWVAPEALAAYPMPAADRPIISALQLPACYMITGSLPAQPTAFLQRLEQRLQAGLRLVQLRMVGAHEADYRPLAQSAARICQQYGARLLLNAPPAWVDDCGAAGVHLNSHRLMALQQRPLGRDKWVAASCHNLEELKHAAAIEVDFAVLSPILPTRSHPQAKPLGWPAFARLTDETPFPVYALGGMAQSMVGDARNHGGQGIAAIGALWEQMEC